MIDILLIAIGSAALSDALDDWQQPDMIFARYRRYILRFGWYSKPLGTCVICMNVWVTLTILTLYYAGFSNLCFGLVGLGLSNLFLKLILKTNG